MEPIPGKLVKSLFQRVLFPDLSAQLIQSLATAGVDLSAPLLDSYPRPAWYAAITLTADSLFAEQAADTRLRSLGRHILTALDSRKLIKGPWLSMAKLMGPKRALKQAVDMGGSSSPVRLEIRELGSKELEVTVAEDQQTEFLAGLLEGLVEVLGGKSARATVGKSGNGSAVFSVSWR